MVSSFNARFRMYGHSRIILGVLVDVRAETITVTSANREIARWNLDEIEVSHQPDGFHIRAADEEVVLGVTEPTGFASALGVSAQGTSRRGSQTRKRGEDQHRSRSILAADWFDAPGRMAEVS